MDLTNLQFKKDLRTQGASKKAFTEDTVTIGITKPGKNKSLRVGIHISKQMASLYGIEAGGYCEIEWCDQPRYALKVKAASKSTFKKNKVSSVPYRSDFVRIQCTPIKSMKLGVKATGVADYSMEKDGIIISLEDSLDVSHPKLNVHYLKSVETKPKKELTILWNRCEKISPPKESYFLMAREIGDYYLPIVALYRSEEQGGDDGFYQMKRWQI